MSLLACLGVYLRGMAMGAADVVPGVSGGTLALITGIYERLIGALARIDMTAVRMLLKFDIKGAWRHVDATFLLLLALGILTSIFTLASLIEHLVETQPAMVWAFFSGLILASALLMALMVRSTMERPVKLARFVFVVAGLAVAVALASLQALGIAVNSLTIFLGGFIAISAMLLPGVSGSFLLLVLGLYQPTLAAVTDLNVAYLLTFAAGAGCGFLVFSKFINFLLAKHHEATLLSLIGLLLGSLSATWPWKTEQAVQDPQYLAAAVCFGAAMALVFLVAYAGRRKTAEVS